MKKILVLLALVATPLLQVNGASVTATNYSEATGAQTPFSTSAGAALLTGGAVQVGTFANDPAALIAALGAPGSLGALLAAFTGVGAATPIGTDFSGLYESVKQGNIANGDAIVGKSIYTLIGNATDLAASTDLAIIRDDESFNFDNPLFTARADITAAGSVILFGTANGPSVTSALGAAPSLQLGTVVPEPMSATLLLCGLALGLRRQRR